MIRIGNAQGFWGDDVDAASRLMRQCPNLDYLTLDYLAEVSLSIMAIQREKDPSKGYAADFLNVVKAVLPAWKEGSRVRLVSNAGGLNPLGCAAACQELLSGMSLTIGVVDGDDVLGIIRSDSSRESFRHLETGGSVSSQIEQIVTANAYIGADPVAEALAQGADIVITGRVADPSLVVGCCVHAYGWESHDYDKLAGATVAGHLIECGTQVTGGISNSWMELDDPVDIGFPVVEVYPDSSCIVTKPSGTGGAVTELTVKEQLLYEISDPSNYLSPDASVSFTNIEVKEEAKDRIRVSGATGKAPTDSYKVSATYRAGWRAEGTLTIVGHDAAAKARRAGEVILKRLERAGCSYERSLVEVLGTGDSVGVNFQLDSREVVLRVAVADASRDAVARFGKEIAPLVTSGPAGTTGYTSGRPKPRLVFGFWPCLIARSDVQVQVKLLHPLAATGGS